MKTFLKNKYLLLLLFSLLTVVAFANDKKPPKPGEKVPPVGLPIDSAILVLGSVAIAYGVSKKSK